MRGRTLAHTVVVVVVAAAVARCCLVYVVCRRCASLTLPGTPQETL